MDERERKRRGPIGLFIELPWLSRVVAIVGLVSLTIVAAAYTAASWLMVKGGVGPFPME